MVVVYNHNEVSYEKLIQSIKDKECDANTMSILSQEVIA